MTTDEPNFVHVGGCNGRCWEEEHYLIPDRRPLRDRIWFYKPGRWMPGWRVVQWRGGDELDWHTLVIGSRWTGAVIFARHPCRGVGRCSDMPRRAPALPVSGVPGG